MNYHGMLICRERLRRNWSQEGLCRGICTVSYLSKIEKGRAEPSEEILRLLLQRLEIENAGRTDDEAAALAEEGYELLFSGDRNAFDAHRAKAPSDRYRASAAGLDLMLLERQMPGAGVPVDEALEPCMNPRQLALQRLLQNRYTEALALLPNAYCHYRAGVSAYGKGDVFAALQNLQTAYDLAAKDGAAWLMLDCKAFIGNCYSNRHDIAHMQEHYSVAMRLAKALGAADYLKTLAYNTASTQLENGQYAQAYAYFAALTEPDVMSLHKLAICCEKTGRTQEAIAALDRADASGECAIEIPHARQMCAVVRFRLENPGYLKDEAYGRLLLDCFEMCRRELPSGYAYFHLPWVIEWFRATRQYRKALDLLNDFPENIK